MSKQDKHAAAPRKKGKAGRLILLLVLMLAIAVSAAVFTARQEILGNEKRGETVTISIAQGSSVRQIADCLKEAGVIRIPQLFRWYVGRQGAAAKLQYGVFDLQAGMSYDELIGVLSVYAPAASVRLTFPEGITAIAIAQKMEDAGLCTAEEFLKEANEGDFSEFTF